MSVWHGINCPFCGQLHAGLPCPSVKGSREVWYPVHHYHGGGEWENAHTAPIGLVTDEQAEILSLRAKLQAAEARADAMERAGAEKACRADQNQKDMLEWRSRAEAAEDEVQRMNGTPEGGWFRAWETADQDRTRLRTRIAELEAEVANLNELVDYFDPENHYPRELKVLQAEVARMKGQIEFLAAELETEREDMLERVLSKDIWLTFEGNDWVLVSAVRAALLGEE